MLEQTPPSPMRFTNKVLRILPADTVRRLSLKKTLLPVGREIEFPGNTIDNLFFLESGVAMMTTTFEDGSQVEVGLFGYESVLGVSGLIGTKRSLNRVYMLLGGSGYSVSVETAKQEFLRCGEFQELLLRNVQAELSQVAQCAACNAKHDVQQRLACWLLLCMDRAQSRTLSISQESLATMIGVRRMSVVVTVSQFKEWGLIDHRRGEIQVLNPEGLEEQACECYRVVKQHLDNAAEFDQGFRG